MVSVLAFSVQDPSFFYGNYPHFSATPNPSGSGDPSGFLSFTSSGFGLITFTSSGIATCSGISSRADPSFFRYVCRRCVRVLSFFRAFLVRVPVPTLFRFTGLLRHGHYLSIHRRFLHPVLINLPVLLVYLQFNHPRFLSTLLLDPYTTPAPSSP